MIDLPAKITEYLATSERKGWQPGGNYASQAGHPCERKLVYDRLDWDKKLLPEPDKLLIFREGNLHEAAVLDLLRAAGITVVEQQRPFGKDPLFEELQLRGKIDGQVQENGQLIPIEIKSMNAYDWARTTSEDDLTHSPKWWIRAYRAQLTLYLLGAEREVGLLLLKNKQTGQLKQIPVHLDYSYADELVAKLKRINAHVATKTYPERIDDRSICERCEFRAVCLPDQSFDAITVSTEQEVVDLLDAMQPLRAPAKELDKLNERWKAVYKVMGDGEYLIGGKYDVQIKTYQRTEYVLPPDVKDKYAEKIPITKATVTPLT